MTLDPDQQATLHQKNRASILLYNTGSWSAGYVIPDEPTECSYITLEPDQQATLYGKNWTSMLLYNTGSRSAAHFIPDEPGQYAVM